MQGNRIQPIQLWGSSQRQHISAGFLPVLKAEEGSGRFFFGWTNNLGDGCLPCGSRICVRKLRLRNRLTQERAQWLPPFPFRNPQHDQVLGPILKIIKNFPVMLLEAIDVALFVAQG